MSPDVAKASADVGHRLASKRRKVLLNLRGIGVGPFSAVEVRALTVGPHRHRVRGMRAAPLVDIEALRVPVEPVVDAEVTDRAGVLAPNGAEQRHAERVSAGREGSRLGQRPQMSPELKPLSLMLNPADDL